MNRQLVYFLQRVASSAASAAVYILADKLASGLQPKSPYRGKQNTNSLIAHKRLTGSNKSPLNGSRQDPP